MHLTTPPPHLHTKHDSECEPDDVRIYKKVYAKMCREGCKKTKSRYFEAGAINDVESPETDPFE